MHWSHCIFHVAGLLVAFAYDDISYKKVATQSHTTVITPTSGDAGNAVDRNTATCTRTRPIGINSPDKTVWWKVDLGGVYSIRSINIQFRNFDGYENRQRGRFAGFSLYVSNSGVIQDSTLCYKDGPALPPLNFTIICAKSGRYVIFYNERTGGVVDYPSGYELDSAFTELCEVIVQGCNNASFYGSKCDIPCPNNCKDNMCHIQSGACITCKTGWTDMNCDTKCKDGWYGLNCSQQCTGHCRDGATCNHVTGQCDRGCAAGWQGDICNNASKEGYFGTNCSQNCSPNCKSDKCRHTDGWCTCDAGLNGDNCTTGTTENLIMKQDIFSCNILVIGLSISILTNLILIGCGILLCRIINSNRVNVPCSLLFCWKKSVYQDIVVKTAETSTYQELVISDSGYQNTTMR